MVEHNLGIREQHSYQEETSYGVKANDNMRIIGLNAALTPNFSQNLQEILNNGGDNAEVKAYIKGSKNVGFNLEFVPTNWDWLKFGTHSVVAETDEGTYTKYIFSPGNSIKSFSYEWGRRQNTNQVITFLGCTINDLKIAYAKGTGTNDSFIKVTAEVICKDLDISTTVSSVPSLTEKPFQNFMSVYEYAGNEVIEINSASIHLNNGINVEDSRYASASLNRTIGEPIPTTKRYDFRFNVNATDNTYINDFNGEVVSGAHRILIERGTDDNIEFTFINPVLDSALNASNPEGVSATDVVGKPTTITIEEHRK